MSVSRCLPGCVTDAHRRKAELQAQRAAGGSLGAPQHFLDTLLMATDEAGQPLNDDAVQEEVDTFLFEGTDTPALPPTVLPTCCDTMSDVGPTDTAACGRRVVGRGCRARHDGIWHHLGAVLHRLLSGGAAAATRGD